MTLLDGKQVAQKMLDSLQSDIESLPVKPGLAVVLIGDNPASKVYVRRKHKKCQKVGIYSEVIELDADVPQTKVMETINNLNDRADIHGILVQLPLPKHLDENDILEKVRFEKDVDGFHVINTGRLSRGLPCLTPCTPTGIIHMLESYDVPLAGQHAVILGRSNIVGKPMAQLLLQKNATVTLCHSRTKNLPELCQQADILVAAVGKPAWVPGDWVKEGAVVVDVGINRLEDGSLVGDVDFEAAAQKASHITPVPGGVGPLTIAQLLSNTVQACRWLNQT
jgi:methylenetetrahydrofolate dehydrogenase (NADP+)/methenyltetrahydrofolate cyclohydrolase